MKLFVPTLFLLLLVKFNISAQSLLVPYANGFETPTQISEWNHYVISGTDDWVVGTPTDFGNASSNAWVTTLSGNCIWNSVRCIETPDFDLSNLANNMTLTFNQQRFGTYCYYYLEYSTDIGVSWQLLDDAGSPKISWQGSNGWTGNYVGGMQKSAIRINFLQGLSSVRFRFRFVSTSNVSRGWMIDDFSISDEFINVTPSIGQSIENMTPYFSQFTLSSTFNYVSPYTTPTLFTNAFYLSSDSNFDYSDIHLGNVNNFASSTLQNWNNTFNLPQGLSGGDYYVITRLDTLNVLAENNENDNISYTPLHLTEPISVNYADHFDSITDNWKKIGYLNDTTWRIGDPDKWHVENAHSGSNAWHSWNQLVNWALPDLESPFLNLTTSNDNSICFWYNHSASFAGNFYLKLPDLMNSNIDVPTFNAPANHFQIPSTRRYGWDCYCQDISSWDSQLSTKIRFEHWGGGAPSPTTLYQVVIDDIYVGQKKPDVSIESNLAGRFTNSQNTTYSLEYVLYNSGLASQPATQTEFYWSTDSLIDPGDFLVASVTEPAIADTTFIQRTVSFIKPTLTSGTYYILWKTDATNVIDEMREYNNIGAMIIYQQQAQVLPYSNDFEAQIDGWRHDATLGHDDWQWSAPTGVQIMEAFSGQKGFITNGGGDTVSKHSRSHLYSPIFDLSQLSSPVMEFDLMALFYDPQYNYTYWPYNMGNIMYSVNGGANWQTLIPQNKSFKRMYSKIDFNTIIGFDDFLFSESDMVIGDILYGNRQPSFRANWDYQSRDYDDNSHYVIDLSFLSGQTVQFMLVYANENAPMEGMLFDNFTIKERRIDLCIPTNKKLLAASGDKKIRTFFHVQNSENYIAPETQLAVYCSFDSILDGTDILVTTRNIDSLKPFEKQLVVLHEDAPNNFGNYRFLLCQTDANNIVNESNESNNVHVFDLAMDSCSQFQYPIQFLFEEEYIDGWSWDHDSSGYYPGNTFRTQKVIGDPVYGANNGEWFMDPLDINGFNVQLSFYPTYHLYSPTFDFSSLYDINLSFDIMCISNTESIEGGNLSYSIDGGQTWIVLFSQDPNAVNWYTASSISALMGQPGWIHVIDWQNCQFDVSFLSGQPNVQFMFTYKGKIKLSYPGPQGFRMDNFAINGTSVDLLTQDNSATIEATLSNPTINVDYQLESISDFNFNSLKTGFYWSEDANFDGNDVFIGEFQESQITPNYSGTLSKVLTYPSPILHYTYYLFHKIDNDLSIAELQENNNLGRTEVHFDMTNVGLAELNLFQSIKQIGDGYEISFVPGKHIEAELLTMLGQKICSGKVDATTGILLLKPGALATGTFLLKILSDGKTSVVRVFHQ